MRKGTSGLIALSMLMALFSGSGWSYAGDRIESPNRKFYISTEQNPEAEYSLFLYSSDDKLVANLGNYYFRYGIEGSVLWLTDDLVEIIIKTGSPGIYSVYYSVSLIRLTPEIWFPVVFRKDKNWVLVGQDDVKIVQLFNDKHEYRIDRPFYHSAIKWLVIDRSGTHFQPDGSLHLIYMDRNKKWITEEIQIPEDF